MLVLAVSLILLAVCYHGIIGSMSYVPYEKQKAYRDKNIKRVNVDLTVSVYAKWKAYAETFSFPLRHLVVRAVEEYMLNHPASRETSRETDFKA